jgi:hypothetical protein
MHAPAIRWLAVWSALLTLACADYGHLRAPSASTGDGGDAAVGDGAADRAHDGPASPLPDSESAEGMSPLADAGDGSPAPDGPGASPDAPSTDTTSPPDTPGPQPDGPSAMDLAFGCPPDPTLRLCFTFDDIGVGTRLVDHSGRGNHGFLNTAKTAGGVHGSALSFTAGTHHAQLPDSESLRLVEGQATFEAWIRPTASPLDGGADIIIGKVDTDYVGWALALYGPEIRLYANGTTSRGASGVRFGFWNHVAVVLGPSGALVYIDGKQVMGMMSPLPIPLKTVLVSIGNTNPAIANDKAHSAFTGELDVVRIYGRVRRPDEICADADGVWMAGSCQPRTVSPESLSE